MISRDPCPLTRSSLLATTRPATGLSATEMAGWPPSAGLILTWLAIASLLGGCTSAPLPQTTRPPVSESQASTSPTTDPTAEQSVEQAQPPANAASNNAALVLLAQSETLRDQGQLPQAIALVERAIRLEPSRGDLWVQLGQLRFDTGEYPRAEQYARKGIALSHADDPVRRRGWLLLADVSDARGDTEGASQIRARWLNARG